MTDVVAFNSYPGWFDSNGVGSDANFRRLVRKDIDALYDAARAAAQPVRRTWRLESR